MKIEVIGDNTIEVHGDIVNVRDSDYFRDKGKEILDVSDGLKIYIIDSDTITSSVIGFLLKMAKRDGKKIELYVKSNHLGEMLKNMDLLEIFNVKKIEDSI